ncbi:putative DNA replication protein [Actinacidiphila reveromycinica]|uniref:Putative DNA replication protein n=1 Tax=Actinacidiphila reveromycinica TaxID=659352 RepID=A0A7U3UUX2_9ACTN|nr:ATP-binding protein [Streptomyces sp. SN-593]BBA99063.1 putative DNA replication protein [Streptomyces sp. SN-593]
MTAATREPRTAVGAITRLAAILTARGIDPAAEPSTSPAEPVTALELADARIPPRYRHARADHPRVTAWVTEIAHTGTTGPGGAPGIATGPSLLIAGPTGTGKTHQAYSAIRSLLAAGVRLRWEATTASDLYAAQRPQNGTNPELLLGRLTRSPLLLLDDLGATKQSAWTEELTYRLVNHRYNHMLPTLVTTNLPVAELRDAVGDRVASRLAEMTERVVLAGGDRRRHRPA